MRHPMRPDQRAPAAIADHGRQVQRAHARLDQDESTLSQHTSQIATNTTAIGAVTSGSGGTAAQDFLGLLATAAVASPGAGGTAQADFLAALSKMTHLGNPSGSASHSGIGTISGTPTDTEFNALNTAYNNAADFINALATLISSLLGELQSGNIMS